ncbi:peptide ABC transporter ATP-binding protein, partial [Xanthomonas citri pv. citri]|nr:peptide ABC transporter ATP-binding protein [Xanthomonas citri pv. citri]
RVMFMDQGMIVEDGNPKEFFMSPKSKRAQDFLEKIL